MPQDQNLDCSSDSEIEEKNERKTQNWNPLGSVLKGRKSELEHETDNTRQSLRTSLAGCEVNKRLVNKFGSIKAILSENERMEKAGLFVIHPYSNFRFAWDMLTLVMLLLNVILVPVFMAFPSFEFDHREKIDNQKEAYTALCFRLDFFLQNQDL